MVRWQGGIGGIGDIGGKVARCRGTYLFWVKTGILGVGRGGVKDRKAASRCATRMGLGLLT